jgi:hypothetical protein
MGKNVIPFRRRKGATDSERAASRGSRIIVRVGRQRYAIDMSCAATDVVLVGSHRYAMEIAVPARPLGPNGTRNEIAMLQAGYSRPRPCYTFDSLALTSCRRSLTAGMALSSAIICAHPVLAAAGYGGVSRPVPQETFQYFGGY